MINKLTLKIICLFLLVFSNFCYCSTITNYHPIYMPLLTSKNELVIAIRIFKKNELTHVLCVHPNHLTTEVIPLSAALSKTL